MIEYCTIFNKYVDTKQTVLKVTSNIGQIEVICQDKLMDKITITIYNCW